MRRALRGALRPALLAILIVRVVLALQQRSGEVDRGRHAQAEGCS